VHELLLQGALPADPLLPHRGFASNALAFMVVPTINLIAPPAAAAGAIITVTVDPPVAADQARTLLLDDFVIQGEPVAVDSLPSATLDFRLPTGADALPPATYLARVRVAGAESLLTVDTTTGQYTGPTVTVV
jgi:hypothetical protein